MAATLAAAIVLAGTTSAQAATCSGVRHEGASNDRALLAILAAQAGRPVEEVGAYREGKFSVFEVSANGDRAFVFFDGPPRRSIKAYVWGGSALSSEYASILADVRRSVPGIPTGLARCFARRVTGGG